MSDAEKSKRDKIVFIVVNQWTLEETHAFIAFQNKNARACVTSTGAIT